MEDEQQVEETAVTEPEVKVITGTTAAPENLKVTTSTAVLDPEAQTTPDIKANGAIGGKTLIDQGEPEPVPEAKTEPPAKAISMNQIVNAVEDAVYSEFDRYWYGTDEAERRFDRWPYFIRVYEDYAIVKIGLQHFRAGYSIANGRIEVAPAEEWSEVEEEWVEVKWLENTTISFGDEVKALGQGMIGGYLIKFTDENDPDLEQDFFDAVTDYGPHSKSIVYYQHALDEILGIKRLGDRFGTATLKKDDVGVWIQHQLDLADEYEAAVYGLVKNKKLGWSSGTASHLVRRSLVEGKAYHIDNWPLGVDASLTPQPAAGPGKTAVLPLKSYQEQAQTLPSLKALLQEAAKTASTDATAAASPVVESQVSEDEIKTEIDMDPKELEAMLKGVVDAAVAPIQTEVSNLKAKLEAEPPTNDPGHAVPDNGDGEKKTFDAMFNLKYGSGKGDDEVKALVMDEVAGGNYKRFTFEQNGAFVKYVRYGRDMMEAKEMKALKQQVFAPSHVMEAIKMGMSMAELKDTMVEAQGSLGGYAVPPNMQENIAARLPGLTAVRGGGATVIVLIRGNSTEVPVYTGGNDRYVGALRGLWGTETQAPTADNATMGMETLTANIYTYKIPMSTSLVEDAMNLVDLVERDIAYTVAIDEDDAFLVGDGAGKPLGWLPSGLNANSLTQVVSASAAALTAAGIKALKRGVGSQYRARASWVANSDTYSDIEALPAAGGTTDYAFPDLSDNDQLLRRPALESEAMPDVAANAFPILFADMSGYYIVERAGLTVMRMQDSNTGINKVELHVRKRVGGRPVETWKAAVQKVAAS